MVINSIEEAIRRRVQRELKGVLLRRLNDWKGVGFSLSREGGLRYSLLPPANGARVRAGGEMPRSGNGPRYARC